jgi:Tfp pilus assembly protein PilV
MYVVKKKFHNLQQEQGVSLVEVLTAVAIMSIVFIAILSTFQTLISLSEQNKLRSNAIFLANEQIEYIRSLPYDTIGTVAGLPHGSIPQNENITYDNHTYSRRTFIQYVDDPADGLDTADTLTADYKRVKVELSYNYQGEVKSFSFVTTVAPKALESLAGAGVLRLNVTDSDNKPVLLSTVHVFNDTIATSVDITTYTNASGTISFPGAWAGGGYEVYVSKTGYSSAQTYTSTTTNPNPSPSPLNVAENGVTEIFFKIDPVSSILLSTQFLPTRTRFLEEFNDASGLSSQTNTQITSNELILSGSSGTYSLFGSATSIPLSPSTIEEWLLLSVEKTTPPSTEIRAHIEYDSGGSVFLPVPETDLPGNAIGFNSFPVDLGNLSTSTYTSLQIVFDLSTSDQNVTSAINQFKLSYHENKNTAPNISINVQGSKTIGIDTEGNPIYKYLQNIQTSAEGIWDSGNIDSDIYTITIPSYTVAEACPSIPITLEPDVIYEQTLTLVLNTVNSLHIQAVSPTGTPIPRAEVRLTSGVIDETQSTGACGSTLFSSLTVDTYIIEIQAQGFSSYSQTVSVSGITEHVATLSL